MQCLSGVSAFIPLASIGWVGFRGSAVSSTTLHKFVIYFFILFKLVFSRCVCAFGSSLALNSEKCLLLYPGLVGLTARDSNCPASLYSAKVLG